MGTKSPEQRIALAIQDRAELIAARRQYPGRIEITEADRTAARRLVESQLLNRTTTRKTP